MSLEKGPDVPAPMNCPAIPQQDERSTQMAAVLASANSTRGRAATGPTRPPDCDDKEHIPALAAVPGVRCARRFRGQSGKRKYVALYHLAAADAQESAAWKTARTSDWTSRLQPHFRDHLRLVCRRYDRKATR
jgi:hypothetical protein